MNNGLIDHRDGRPTLMSLFDGSGGFPLAGVMHGIEPVYASEIEPFAIRVTKLRFPGMKHLGSVTDINGAEVEPVDIITFGSPCQDLSVAGKQAGIHDGQRSNLFFEAVRIIREMREHDRAAGRADQHIRPRFAVWENVPGAFSSNKGKDFQAVLQALCEIGCETDTVPFPQNGKWTPAGCVVGDGYSVAWRVYDAQFWGVPQRRKRIYLIADFGSERAGEILFESESVRGNPPEGGKKREGTAEDAEGSAGGSHSEVIKDDKCGAFCAGASPMARSIGWDEKVSPTLKSANAGLSMHAVCYHCESMSLDLFSIKFAKDGKTDTLASTDYKEPPVVCYGVENHSNDSRVDLRKDDKCQTLTSRMGTGGGNVPMVLCAIASSCVNAEITDGSVSPTLMARAGTGGNQLPLLCLNDQGSSVMDVSDRSGCLRAQEHGHQPVVCMERNSNE